MADRYSQRFGVRVDVLYPSRGEDSPSPVALVRTEPTSAIVVAYGGMIHQAWAVEALQAMASVLVKLGGRLDLYVPYSEMALEEMGLAGPSIRRIGFLPARQMSESMRLTAHVLFLPASFRAQEMTDASTLFPSKLADYTAVGLPILIWGPMHSSAARWATENPGVAELVTDQDSMAIQRALAKLAGDPGYANDVASNGVAAGTRDFESIAVRNRFFAALRPD
jgi:hypothetical protein